ncbi:MAG TPA: penicillin-binding transpeptidase domain-containing protein [Gemmatimonadaceae bacterium]|nr:penicillin-binding transpeptidase domain-containing protein [Gemmatimonadaceae bacterium]
MRVDRLSLVHGGLLLFAGALVWQTANLQLVETEAWAAQANRQHFSPSALPAVRGPILDAAGTMLVETRELTRLSVAPREVRNLDAVIRALRRAGVPPAALRRLRDPERRWVDLPGAFPPADVAALSGTRGVYPKPVVDRVYAPSGGVRRIVGRLDADGRPLDGLELALDSLLRGDSARMRLPRDRFGRPMAGPAGAATLPRPGATVTLTLNRALQDICERALALAVDTLGASGGDIVVLNPHTGEILAMASRRTDPRATANTAISEPFEPGSTLKPFVAAALLARRKAHPGEIIPTYDGVLQLERRVIRDVHKAPEMTLADVIRHSSNIGIVQFGDRLSQREKYELLRDLGFGTPTGIPLPAEASGTLREPRYWSRQTPASLMMGYEIAVTPLQLAAAYSTLANGGVLIEPQLIREVRSPEGDVLYRARPRPVRRIFTPEAADAVRGMLLNVVDSGTAMKADLVNYEVGGKSGTARRVVGGRYAQGRYTASFVGVFPVNAPQYVVLVKLDDPQGAIYGGQTAAPLTRVVLEAALAARDAALDRLSLAAANRGTLDSFVAVRRTSDGRDAPNAVSKATPLPVAAPPAGTLMAALPAVRPPRELPPETTRTFDVPVALVRASGVRGGSRPRPVPEVTGAPVRDAVRMLHDAGFRVVLERGAPGRVVPAPGTMLDPGALVRVGVP